MNSIPDLKIDFCSQRAARFACEHWHYSQVIPTGKLVRVGVWECGLFVGAVVFGRGASAQLYKRYNLLQTQGAELVRVAMRKHSVPVTKCVAVALCLLKRVNPNIKLVLSFADSSQGHLGTIYQAGNWLYLGESKSVSVLLHGKRYHYRSVLAKYGDWSEKFLRARVDPQACHLADAVKYRYAMPMTKAMRKQLQPLVVPYPKASEVSDGGSNRTAAA